MSTVFSYRVGGEDFDIVQTFPGPEVTTLERAQQLTEVVRPNWPEGAGLALVRTDVIAVEYVKIKSPQTALFMFYPSDKLLKVRTDGEMVLLEDKCGNRMWKHRSFIV